MTTASREFKYNNYVSQLGTAEKFTCSNFPLPKANISTHGLMKWQTFETDDFKKVTAVKPVKHSCRSDCNSASCQVMTARGLEVFLSPVSQVSLPGKK